MKKAVVIISLLLAAVMLLSSCGKREFDDSEYELNGHKYDMIFYGLNETQRNIIVNYNNNKVYRAARESYYLTNEEYGDKVTVTNESGVTRYNVYVKFTDFSEGESYDAYERLMEEYVSGHDAILPLFCEDGTELKYSISDNFKDLIDRNKKGSIFN